MDYQNKDTLYAYFHSVIDKEVKAQSDALMEDIKRLKYEAQVSIENDLKEEQINTLKLAETEMNRSYHLRLAAYQRELDIKIMKKRNESINVLFKRLKDYLVSFSSSKEYASWITKQLDEIDVKTIRAIHIDKNDQLLKNHFSDFSALELKDDLIGGAVFIEKTGKKIIDLSFKNKLEEAEDWFYSHVKWPTSGDLNE